MVTLLFRLKRMIECCVKSLELNLASGYIDHLNKVKTILEDQLEAKQKDMKGTNFIVFCPFHLL